MAVVDPSVGELTILRDRWGIPHIRAGSVSDLGYGQGLADAEARTWQVTLDGWRAEGRTAEVLGAPGLEWDVFCHQAQLPATARACYARLTGETKDYVDAYVEGVNAGLATAAAPELTALGAQPDPWEPWFPLGVFLANHVLFGTFPLKLWRAQVAGRLGVAALEVLRLDGPYPAQPIVGPDWLLPVPLDLDVLARVVDDIGADVLAASPTLDSSVPTDGGQPASGSNCWAVGGARTASGLPLVAGDPHRTLDLPNGYHQLHLSCPELDVIGFGFPGVPGIQHFGHAGAVAWGITNAMADYQDLFVEELRRDGDQVRSRTADGWAHVQVGSVSLAVRDAEPRVVETLVTLNGPVIMSGDAGRAISLRTPAFVETSLGFEALLPLLRSRTVDDVEAALAHWVEPVNNVVAADRDGRLRYWVAGRVPRRDAANQWLPVPGWREHGWDRTIPYAELPRHDAGPDGHVVTANQRITRGSGVIGAEHAKSARAERIAALLGDRRQLTVADFAVIHADSELGPARHVQAALAGFDDLPTAQAEVARVLIAWDRRMDANSHAAALFASFRSALLTRLGAVPALAAALAPSPGIPALYDRWMTPPVRLFGGLSGLLARRHERPLGVDVVGGLRDALGDVVGTGPATWGDRHGYAPVHALAGTGVLASLPDLGAALAVEPVPLSGDADCVQATASVPGVTDACARGPVARYVWDLADRDQSRWVVPHGASGDPASPHYTDQLSTWASGGSLPVVSDWDRLTAECTSVRRVTREHGAAS